MLRCYALFFCVLLSACGMSIPSTTALAPSSMNELGGGNGSTHTTVVKAREFRLPTKDFTTTSIIVGPDKNLWFTELRHIGHMSVTGQLGEVALQPTQMIPGMLTNSPDGNIWANTAERFGNQRDSQSWSPYQLFKITPNLHVGTIFLGPTTFLYPTNLVRMGSKLYTGMTTITEQSGSDVIGHDVDRVNEDGSLTTLFSVPYPYNGGDGWFRTLATPDDKLWLYDYTGALHGCELDSHCSYTKLPSPEIYVESLQGTLTTYSPDDHNVYVCNANTSTIYKVSLTGKLVGRYTNQDIAFGFCAMMYYHDDMWVTLNGDSQGRPMLGRLTPSGTFSEISLPFYGGAAVTAMVDGPDGHLWYLRGRNVGEILSPL
jgi:hypothetical protein